MDYKRRKSPAAVSLDTSLRVPFSAAEKAQFRAYLKANDKKAGAFARTAILEKMAKEGA